MRGNAETGESGGSSHRLYAHSGVVTLGRREEEDPGPFGEGLSYRMEVACKRKD